LQIHDIFFVYFFTLITLNKVSRRSFIQKKYLEVFFLDFQTLKRVNLTRNITGGLRKEYFRMKARVFFLGHMLKKKYIPIRATPQQLVPPIRWQKSGHTCVLLVDVDPHLWSGPVLVERFPRLLTTQSTLTPHDIIQPLTTIKIPTGGATVQPAHRQSLTFTHITFWG